MGTIVGRSGRGAENVKIKTESPLLELDNGVVQRLDANGVRSITFPLLSFNRQELLDRLLSHVDSGVPFSRGVVTSPTTIVPAFTFDVDSPLSALQELAEMEGLEVAIRRDGGVGFLVDMVTEVGKFEDYGEILQTVTDDAFLAQSAPSTNFGTGISYQLQRGPGGTDKDAVLKFNLQWLQGLGLTITDARMIFTSDGTGSGANHVLQFVPIRSATSGPFTGQPREIRELESTWNVHITGRSWASGGARGTNDDRDNANEWQDTLVDPTTAGGTVIFTGQNLLGTRTLAQFLQTVADGTEAFFGDGVARFVFDASGSGQTGKISGIHSREATTVSVRPQLLITVEKIRPRFLFRKNIVGIERDTDARTLATRVYPAGQGGPDTGARVTIGPARWTVNTVPTTTTFTLVETAINEDGQLIGNRVERLSDGVLFEITATGAANQLITTSAAHGLSPGDVVSFRENAAGDELVFVESPTGITNFGAVTQRIVEDDIPTTDNLVTNPAIRDFADIGGGEFLADGWNKVGLATVTQETDRTLTFVGGSAQRVVVAAVERGLESDVIPVTPVSPNIFFTAFIQFTIVSGGGVEFFLEHSTEGRFPREGAEVQATARKIGTPQQLTIEGKEFPAGTIKLVIRAIDGATTFVLDAAQLTNSGFEAPFFEGRAPVTLWQRGLDHLAINNVPVISHKIPNALDLTGALPADFPYDQVLLGAEVRIDDERLEIDDIDARVLDLTEELLQARTISMSVSNSKDDLIDQLTKLKRRERVIVDPNVGLPEIQKVELDVDDAGEVIILLTGGDNTLSFKFIVAAVGSPTPSYQSVVDSGISSNLIEGERTATGVIVGTGERRDVRVVAFGLLDGGGRAGESEARTVAQPSPFGSALRARASRSTDLTILTGIAQTPSWDLEDVDIGNLHSLTDPNNKFLQIVQDQGFWLSLAQIAWDSAGAGNGRRPHQINLTGTAVPVQNVRTDRPTPNGQSTTQGYQVNLFPKAGSEYRVVVNQDSGVSKDIQSAQSFFSLLRIPTAQDNPRVQLSGSGTDQTFPASTDTEVDWLASDIEQGGTWFSGADPERLTLPTSGDGPLLVMAQVPTFITAAISDGLFGSRIKKNGTTIIGRHEIRNVRAASSTVGITDTVLPVMALDLSAVATDFYSHELRQELGATLTIDRSEGNFIAVRLPGGANPRAEVALSAVEAITTATPTAIPWDTEVVDVGGLVDIGGAPTRISSSFTGIALVIGQVRWASSTVGLRRVFLRLNGADTEIDPPWLVEDEGPDAAGEIVQQMIAWVHLVNADFIELMVEQTSGGNLNVIVADSFLQLIRVADA